MDQSSETFKTFMKSLRPKLASEAAFLSSCGSHRKVQAI